MVQKPIEVFLSYCCEDEALRDRLEIQLSGLKQQGVISSWHDRQILVGDELKKEIDHRIQTADIILLLVTPHFIASEYSYNIELPAAIAQHDAEKDRAVYILIRPVSDWQEYSFPNLQVGGKPVMNWLDEDVFVDIVDAIRTAAKQLLANQQKQERLSSRSLPTEPIPVSAPQKQIPIAKPQFFTINLTDRISLEMIAIPGGKFWMGSPDGEGDDSERPRHEVTIAPFFMSKYPITQAQYQAVMGSNPSSPKDRGESRPVGQVSWHNAIAFCQELSSRGVHGVSPKEILQFSLPNEAQWEYACRAGTETPFYFGETISTEQANYDGNYSYGSGRKGIYREHATDVGTFPPNNFGLYDTHGNVCEWCADYWHDNYENAPKEGIAWLEASDDSNRVLRGGAWFDYPRSCRSASRTGTSPEERYDFFGFRVVCV